MRLRRAALVGLVGSLLMAAPVRATYTAVALGGTAATGPDSATTGTANTTGATLLVLSCSWYSGTTATITASDSKGNTWTPLTSYASSGAVSTVQLFYVNSATPTVGTGHTFTCAGVSTYALVTYQAWATSPASPFDQQNGNIDGGNSQTTGSITPTESNELVVAAIASYNGTTFSINGGFTTAFVADFVGGTSEGGGSAYLVQAGATAANPTWTSVGSSDVAAAIASFKTTAGAGSAGGTSISLTGVGR